METVGGDEPLPGGVRPARSSVLRLRGLPFQATENDIEEFFKGYELKQCQICKRNGRSTGEAYVQLENETVAGGALHELNCKHMGRRYIEIFEASESDLSPGLEGKGVLGYVLRLRGLPYSATRSDAEKFFEGIQIYKGEEGVVFSVTSTGRPTGEAYVEFMSEEDQQEAMKRHKQHMGSRYIELFKSTKADLLQALQQNRFYKEQAERRQWLAQNMPSLPPESSGVRSPYNSGAEDVTKFLQSLSLGGPQSGYQVMPPPLPVPPDGHGKYGSPQENSVGPDAGDYAPRDAQNNYLESAHYPHGPGPPPGPMPEHLSNDVASYHYPSTGRGPVSPANNQAPPGVQGGQQMLPPDIYMQHYHLMQQQMLHQQHQLGGWVGEGGVPPHSAMPHIASQQAPYPSGYASSPGMPMAMRGQGGYGSGPYYQYPTGPGGMTPGGLPASAHGEMPEGHHRDSGLDVSGGGSPGDGHGDGIGEH